jgi:hypothetical protein
MSDEERTRGLEAIRRSREERQRGKWPVIPGRFWLWTGTILAVWAVVYYKRTQGEIESQKARIFARQRGVAAELGPRFEPLRDRIEKWTVEASGPYAGDLVDPDAKTWDFAGQPGIYLRLRIGDATSVPKIRKASDASLRDGFTACLFHVPNPDPASGPPCKYTHECAAGSFCNEVDHCMPAAQPFNMRAAYRGTRILTDDWAVELRAASDDMRMRLLEREFDAVVNDDVPLVIDLMTRAQFFLLVLDEDPGSGVPADAGREGIQAAAHPSRVMLWGLKAPHQKPLLRLRRDLDAKLVMTGEAATAAPEIQAAQQRQANGCQLALDVREALGK